MSAITHQTSRPGHDPVLRDLARYECGQSDQSAYEAYKESRIEAIYEEIIQGHTLSDALGCLPDAGDWAKRITQLALSGKEREAGYEVRGCMREYAEKLSEDSFEKEFKELFDVRG
jgi:hypothetical protein